MPYGIGRAIAKDDSRFMECYFRNGQCQGLVRNIWENGESNYINFIDGK